MSPSQQLATAVNFAAEYYSQLVTNPAALAQSYHASCVIERGEKTHSDATAFFGGLPVGNFRVVISDVTVNDNATTKNGINFTVTASNVFKSGTPAAQFTQTLEIVKHATGYYVAVDKQVAVTCSPVASAFAAFSATAKKAPAKQPASANASARLSAPAKAEKAKQAEPEKPAAPMMSGVNWSEDTPPAFAAQPKEMPPPMPMEETPAASPPKSAPSTAAPSPAAPAKAAKAKATPKKEAAPAKPAAAEPKAAAAEAPKPKPATEEKPAPAAAAPAPQQEKPTKAEGPKAPLSFADRVRGGAAPAPAPKAAAAAEAPKAVEEAPKAPAEPEAAAAPSKAAEPTPAPKPAQQPKAAEEPAPAAAAAPVEEAKPAAEAPVAAKATDEDKPKGNAWSRGPLTFSKDEQMKPVVPKPATVVEKPATPAPEEAPAAKADAKPARTAAAATAGGAPGAAAGGRPLSSTVQHYHVFVRGLPTNCTDDDLYELMSKHVPMTRNIKVDSKLIQETVRPSNDVVSRTRTFAFVCLDCSKAEVPTHIATLKGQRLSMGPGAGTMHFDEVHDKAAFSPAGGAGARGAGAGASRPARK